MAKKHWTKDMAVSDFKIMVRPYIRKRYGKYDKVALRTAWNDYVDMLNKDGLISDNQAYTWVYPFK